MSRLSRLVLTGLALLLLVPSAAISHEFILKPDQLHPADGQAVSFSVISAHVFMVSEELEPYDKVSVSLLKGASATDVPLTANEKSLSLDGQVQPDGDGVWILAGHRKGMIWCNTTKGWKQAPKSQLEGVISSGLYEKFCKTLLMVGDSGKGFDAVVGQRFEIVPIDNPATAKVGDDIRFKFLLDGKPVSPEAVTATYDGFTSTPNTYAYFTEPYGQGEAKVKISHPGVWMVRAQYPLEGDGVDYDKVVLRSVLVFEVQ